MHCNIWWKMESTVNKRPWAISRESPKRLHSISMAAWRAQRSSHPVWLIILYHFCRWRGDMSKSAWMPSFENWIGQRRLMKSGKCFFIHAFCLLYVICGLFLGQAVIWRRIIFSLVEILTQPPCGLATFCRIIQFLLIQQNFLFSIQWHCREPRFI